MSRYDNNQEIFQSFWAKHTSKVCFLVILAPPILSLIYQRHYCFHSFLSQRKILAPYSCLPQIFAAYSCMSQIFVAYSVCLSHLSLMEVMVQNRNASNDTTEAYSLDWGILSLPQISAAYTSMTQVSSFENGRNEKIMSLRRYGMVEILW